MKSWARMKWRQHPATPVRPASSTTRLGTGNVTRVGTKSAPFTPGADPSRDGSGWPSRRKGSISMKSVTLFNPITRPAITTTTAKKYIDLFFLLNWTGTRREIDPEWKRTNDKIQLWINFLLMAFLFLFPSFRANHLFRSVEKRSASIENNSLSLL